jgi:SSS family solute:Na+ symporter
MLLITGFVLLWLGIDYLGGLPEFWENIPRTHRTAFTNFNTDPNYNSVGLFWQDGMANTAMFIFLNQGLAMRLLSARTIQDSRKALIVTAVVLMPIAALVVASGGWVAKALVNAGALPPDIPANEAFFIAADFLSQPGVFGLVMAALTAALMSTVDTLITAVAAIFVNDIYGLKRPHANEQEKLKWARISSISVTLIGVALVPVFMGFDSIYSAHGAFTAAVTPPLVVALLLGVFWKRFSSTAATATMIGGSIAIAASVVWPELITPFAHGVPMQDVGDGFLAGKNQYKFMRAFYGLSVCAIIGVVVGRITHGRNPNELKGLVWGSVKHAIAHYKGQEGTESESAWTAATCVATDATDAHGRDNHTQLPNITISGALATQLAAGVGDLVYVTDKRWWFGGLRSAHARVHAVDTNDPLNRVHLSPEMRDRILAGGSEDRPLQVKRLY